MYGLPQARILANKLLKKMTCTPWLLWTAPHARPLETCQSPCMVQPLCWWIWNKVHWNKNLQHLYNALRKEKYKIVEDYEGELYCGTTQVELQEMMGWHVNGTVCYETTGKVWTCCPCKTTTLSIFAQHHSIRKGQSNTNAKQWQSITRQSQQKSASNKLSAPSFTMHEQLILQ